VLSRVLALIKKEFLSIWRDPKSRIIIIVPPILQLFIFANALTMEIKNIDMAVVDRCKTFESRELISSFTNSKWFRKINLTDNIESAKKDFEVQKIEAVLVIGPEFAVNIKKGQKANVQLILDGRNISSAGAINGYTSKIVSQYSQETAKRKGIKGAQINVETRNWFNPNTEYKWYLLASLIVMLALVVTLILTALSVARERELGTFEQLIVSPCTSFEILLGKTIPPLFIALTAMSFMTAIAVACFGVPFQGSFFVFIFSCFIALLSIVGIGLFISSICKTQQQAFLGVFAFMMPAVLLSGFISPIEDMPPVFQLITWLNPVRFFMNISRGLLLKGMSFEDVLMNLIPLLVIAAFTLTLASAAFKRNLE
jgi:ABC-2 type transport system permease protein